MSPAIDSLAQLLGYAVMTVGGLLVTALLIWLAFVIVMNRFRTLIPDAKHPASRQAETPHPDLPR